MIGFIRTFRISTVVCKPLRRGKSSIMAGRELLSQERIEQCREYMGEDWIAGRPEISVSYMSGGLTNFLYHLSIKSDKNECQTPKNCLLRMFSQIWSPDQLAINNVVVAILAERGIGPKIYGVLPCNQGRLEEYYFCRELNTSELVPYYDSIAKIAGKLNRQSMPLPRNDDFIYNSMNAWLTQIRSDPVKIESNRKKMEEIFSGVNWEEEISWLKTHLRSVGSPILFCHNDLNEGNFLLLDGGSKEIKLIDFEFCNYNYRGFELAQLFYESSINMTQTDYPHFKHTPDNYPREGDRKYFVAQYLAAFQPDKAHGPEDVDSVLREVELMKLAVDFYWALWALAKAQNDDRFGYIEYAELRIGLYRSEKANILLQ